MPGVVLVEARPLHHAARGIRGMTTARSRLSARSERRRRLFLAKITRALVPVARVLLTELCGELRQALPAGRDIDLLSSFLADPALDAHAACRAILERHEAQTGMRIVSSEPRATLLTIRLSLDAWSRALNELVDPNLAPCLEIELRATRSSALKGHLLNMDRLTAVGVEQAYVVFQNYWLDRLATVATPMTSMECETGR